MTPSTIVTYFLHHRSVHDESNALVAFVGITALEPPIHRSLLVDADIGLGPPTTYPRPNKWWIYHVGFIN